MNTFWALMGFLPLLMMGAVLYGLIVLLPRKARSLSHSLPPREEEPAPPSARRRRVLTPISELDAGQPGGPSPPQRDRGPAALDSELAGSGVPERLVEEVTVVLRRQIPPRDGEPARSWLGGLPQMPSDVEWPRSVSAEHPDRGERPLHFLAQLCCADLPDALWGGIGPREGWLLVFLDPNQGAPDGDEAFRIVHVREPGPERQPPFDLGPVHDRVYTGGSYRWLAAEEVPAVWRRWPVDLVCFPNPLRHDQGRSCATPPDFAGTLYEGAPVAQDRSVPGLRPYTFAQALRAVRTLVASMRAAPPPITNSHVDELLEADPGLTGLRATLSEQIANAGAQPDTPRRTERLEQLQRIRALLDSCGTAADLRQALEARRNQHVQWRGRVASDGEQLARLLEGHPPETPLAQQDWEELQASLGGRTWRTIELRIEYPSGAPKHLDLRERTERVQLAAPEGTGHEALRDWLDPTTRARVPPEFAAELEPWARALTSGRPHRMGGYHDGVQSDAVEGPQTRLLLLQIASDEAMDWCWGDLGAYYFWIRPKHLAAGDFTGVELDLECH